MENSSTYKNIDLQSATVEDLWKLHPEITPSFIDFESFVTENDARILDMYYFAKNNDLKELLDKLKKIFSKELNKLLQ